MAVSPRARDLLLQVLRGFGVGDVVDDDVRTLLGEREHDRLADPRVPSRDDRNLAVQRHRYPSPGRGHLHA